MRYDLRLHIVKAVREQAELIIACKWQRADDMLFRETLDRTDYGVQRTGDDPGNQHGENERKTAESKNDLEGIPAQLGGLSRDIVQRLGQTQNHETLVNRVTKRQAHKGRDMPILFLRSFIDIRHDIHVLAMNQGQDRLEGILHENALAAIKAEGLGSIRVY